jgi:hypothetical protein
MRRRRDPRGYPVPQAIDPASGFKVPLGDLVKQWDGEMVAREFVDRRNPQDFPYTGGDREALPYSRPESPDRFVALPILWEDDSTVTTEAGGAVFSEGAMFG